MFVASIRARRLTLPGRLILSMALVVLATGCARVIDQRGSLPDPDDVLAIQPGVQTKDEVAALLGTPSTVGTFDDRNWYYISKRTKTVAFFSPSVQDQQILVIKFDDGDVVEAVDLFGLDDAVAVDPESRETPTYGQRLTLLQQLLGNIGRFSTGEEQQ